MIGRCLRYVWYGLQKLLGFCHYFVMGMWRNGKVRYHRLVNPVYLVCLVQSIVSVCLAHSVCFANSVYSVCTVCSVCSDGSVCSLYSVCSVCSVWSVCSVFSVCLVCLLYLVFFWYVQSDQSPQSIQSFQYLLTIFIWLIMFCLCAYRTMASATG